MSRYRVLCTVAALAIAGCSATAQTAVTNIFENVSKVIPDAQLTGVSDTRALTSSSLFDGGQLTGTWTPDNYDVDQLFALDMGTQTLLLSPFGGTNLNGDWPLFLADLDFGDPGALVRWGVIVTAVPEPSTWTLLGLGGFVLGMGLMRRRLGL